MHSSSLMLMASENKKAVAVAKKKRAMPQLQCSVESSRTTFSASLRVAKLRKPGFRAPNIPAQNRI